MMPRKRPYTAIGIARVPCARCGQHSRYQWQICADGNIYRGLCARCDYALNEMVLEWVGDPLAEEKMQAYGIKLGIPDV